MLLELDGITKKYGQNTVVNSVTQRFDNGVYGLLGPNGAGKTTLINIIATVLRPDDGCIKYDGNKIADLKAYRSLIGYLPQHMGYYLNFTGEEFLDYIWNMKERQGNQEQVGELLKRFNLYDVRNKKISTYSGGMKQRLGICQAVIGCPKIILLDEPTVGLDLEERAEFKKYIQKLGQDAIVFLSTHIVSDVEETASEVLLMKKGVIEERITREKYCAMTGSDEMTGLEGYYLKKVGKDMGQW